MTVIVKNIIPRKQAEAVQNGQYTAFVVKTIIDKFTVTNTSAANAQLSCNLIASGDAAGDDNLVLDAKTIAPGDTYACPELVGQTLESGGSISTLASAAASLTISSSGREIS
jgi:hypothetical protein